MMDTPAAKQDDEVAISLCQLYGRFGYLPFKMSKFEEYDLYLRNKDFLVDDRIITFNDTDGKLLALKPDVTLSIIKNTQDMPGTVRKVCYNESVYRVSNSTGRFKEVTQTGLECIGDVTMYDIYEVVSLAATSLAQLSESFVLQVSDQSLLLGVLDRACADRTFALEAVAYVQAKNEHDLLRLCDAHGVSEENRRAICGLMRASGKGADVLAELRGLFGEDDLAGLAQLVALLEQSPYEDRVTFDFSLVENTKYYNGFVFQGFISGLADSILAGGQYDRMMSKMGRDSRAIGFALYLDMVELLAEAAPAFDVDVLLVYDETVPSSRVAAKVQGIIASGRTVSAQRALPEGLRYAQLVDLSASGISASASAGTGER